MQVGLCLAILLSVGRLVLVERAIPATSLEKAMPLMGGAVLVLYGVLAVLLLRNLRLPAWATWRLALAMSLLGVSHLLVYPVPEPDWHSVLAIGGNVAGATLLVMTSLRLVRSAEDRHVTAERLVRTLEGHVRRERTLLHEVASTVAGITAASRLLTGPTGLDREDRERLAQLLMAETARMERLIAAGHDLAGPQPIA